MIGKRFALISLMSIVLLLAACGSDTTSTPASPSANTPASTITLGDASVKNITVATQSGSYSTPLDSTPNLDGTTIYFTAKGQNGAGVFRVPARGGEVTALFTGSPFVNPRGIVISPDGKQLFITDPGAGNGGTLFLLSIQGGSPAPLQGSIGTAPQNLHVVNQNGQQTIYFTGKDPSGGQPAVLTLPISGGQMPSIVYKGSPLVTPDGIVVTSSGIVYVSDRSAGGSAQGKVFKIQGSSLSVIVNQVRTGNPAGIALSPDESVLLVSSLQPDSLADQVLLVHLKTGQTGIVSKIVGQNHNDAGGLHASPGQKSVFSWCGTGRQGAFTMKSAGNPMALNIAAGQGLVYTIEM